MTSVCGWNAPLGEALDHDTGQSVPETHTQGNHFMCRWHSCVAERQGVITSNIWCDIVIVMTLLDYMVDVSSSWWLTLLYPPSHSSIFVTAHDKSRPKSSGFFLFVCFLFCFGLLFSFVPKSLRFIQSNPPVSPSQVSRVNCWISLWLTLMKCESM